MVAVPDLGPPERLGRGDVVVQGSGAPVGRARSLVDELPERLKGAAGVVLASFERAAYPGFVASSLQPRVAGMAGRDLTAAAIDARRRLAALEQALPPLLWSALWHMMLFDESQERWAMRARGQGYPVSRKAAGVVLIAALDAVAAVLEGSGRRRWRPASAGQAIGGGRRREEAV